MKRRTLALICLVFIAWAGYRVWVDRQTIDIRQPLDRRKLELMLRQKYELEDVSLEEGPPDHFTGTGHTRPGKQYRFDIKQGAKSRDVVAKWDVPNVPNGSGESHWASAGELTPNAVPDRHTASGRRPVMLDCIVPTRRERNHMNRSVLLKAIAILEFVGGVNGLILVLAGWVWNGFHTHQLVGAVIGISLSLLALFAGLMLWRDRRIGYATSAVVQLAQLVKIATPHFAFMVAYGADFAVVSVTNQQAGGSQSRLTYSVEIGSTSTIESSRPPGATQVFGLSIFSCLALNALRKGQPVTSDNDLNDLDEGGSAPNLSEPRASDGQPDWVIPLRVKLVAGVFVFVAASCAGRLMLSSF